MIRLENVYFKKTGITLLKNISTDINSGEVISIIGRENCGKTLLLKAICIASHITSGKIIYNGNLISGFTAKNRLRILSHPYSPISMQGKTVYNIIAHSRLCAKNFFSSLDEEDKTEINRQIDFFGLNTISNRKFETISDGEKKRTKLAYLFARDAEIIVMEKPETNLDLHSLNLLSAAIQKYVINGKKTVIMENSNINIALENSDRILTLKDGTIVVDKKPSDYTEDDFRKIFDTELYISKNLMTGKNIVTSVNMV